MAIDYEWRLRLLMAERGMFKATDLAPRLAEHGVEHEVYTYDAIRGSLVVSERIAQTAIQLDFARKHAGPI